MLGADLIGLEMVSSSQGAMKGHGSIAMRTVTVASACALALLLTCAGGCSTAGTAAAAESAAKAAAANIAQSAAATAANTTVTVNSSSAAAAVSPAAPKTIWGRWIRTGQIINPDGSLSQGLISEITFARNGSFISDGRAGVTAIVYKTGTFQIFGNVLTTKIGKLQQTMTYQIKGSELFLTNSKSHQILVFQRG
jgi:hypothetical protein